MTRWLVDAQLPLRLARHLRLRGHDAVHTSELPEGNRSTDAAINALSVREERIVITKDADFVVSFHQRGEPYKLLLVSTGNIGNTDLLALFDRHLGQLEEAFTTGRFVELLPRVLVLHC